MANNQYTIVIVPHGDPAAQALTKARVASIVHASRQPPPPHAKAAAASHAAASKSGSARPKRGGGAPKSGPRGVHAGQRIRSWSVVVGNDKYDVTDFGTTCGYKNRGEWHDRLDGGPIGSRVHDAHDDASGGQAP